MRYFSFFMFIFTLLENKNYKLIKKDHDCKEEHTYIQWLKLKQCAVECEGFIFTFKKGKCDGSKQCPCYCVKGVASTKETCTFRADPLFDVYASKGADQMSTTEVTQTKAPGNTSVLTSSSMVLRISPT